MTHAYEVNHHHHYHNHCNDNDPGPEKGPTPAHLRQQYGGNVKLYDGMPLNPAEIALLNDYPPGSTNSGMKIQFNADGTAYIWKQDPDLANNPNGPWAIEQWIGKDGVVHKLSNADYLAVASGKKTMADVIKAFFNTK